MVRFFADGEVLRGYCARRREYAEKRVVGVSRRDRADHRAGDRSVAAALYLRHFPENGGRGPGGRHSVAFSENHRAHFCDASAVAAFPIRSGGHRLAPQPAETASHDAARLHDGAGDAIFGGDHSRHAGADDPQRRESRAGRIRHPAQRDDSSLGQHSENRRMRAGDHVDDRHADPYGSVRRVHRHAGRYDDRRPGRSGRRHHGRARPAAVDARLR